jgi:4-carboxymuconolactone decarboxylase
MSEDAGPRIGNLPREEWTDEAREVFAFWGEPGAWENGSRTNMTMTMAQHPKLAMAYNTFGKHLLLGSTLAVRPRELVVLRTAWHLKCGYEWHYHVGYALKAGLTMEEIGAVRDGPSTAIWEGKDEDRAVLTAVDELYRDSRLSDATWDELSRFFDRHQMMDLLFTIGNYVMLGWAAASMGIGVEDDVDMIGFDLKTRSGKPAQASSRPLE